jgi:hypothetical protein
MDTCMLFVERKTDEKITLCDSLKKLDESFILKNNNDAITQYRQVIQFFTDSTNFCKIQTHAKHLAIQIAGNHSQYLIQRDEKLRDQILNIKNVIKDRNDDQLSNPINETLNVLVKRMRYGHYTNDDISKAFECPISTKYIVWKEVDVVFEDDQYEKRQIDSCIITPIDGIGSLIISLFRYEHGETVMSFRSSFKHDDLKNSSSIDNSFIWKVTMMYLMRKIKSSYSDKSNESVFFDAEEI